MLKQRVGIAGYMGSGKSTGARLLTRDGGAILDADALAKDVMRRDESIQHRLAEYFGAEVVCRGDINFSLLGNRAFRSPETLSALNSIIHPPLVTRLRTVYEKLEGSLCILDAALIGFWHIDHWFTTRIWVTAPREVRMKRLQKKTTLTPEELERRACLQEQLVTEPGDPSWIYIPNEGTLEGFGEALKKTVYT